MNKSHEFVIDISIASQCLQLLDCDKKEVKRFSISTAKKGAGNLKNSEQTPLGKHYIRAKIGDSVPANGIFVGRRFTGEIYTPEMALRFPDRDWILTRILWLCGKEIGINRLGDVDTMQRYIYIHGTPDTEPMGTPLSHGCIRMRNEDLLYLFDKVSIGTQVNITEG